MEDMSKVNNKHDGKTKKPSMKLLIAAVGVIFGDIGTSPLYSIREAISHSADPGSINTTYGILSLIFWSLVIVVCFKYVSVILRVDNKGEGGMFALLGLGMNKLSEHSKKRVFVFIVTCIGAALFFSDAAITPAMSVLSAVEGIHIAIPSLKPFTLFIAIVILTFVFLSQKKGTASIGSIFGPVMVIWFLTLAVLGVYNIIQYPSVILGTLNPINAIKFFQGHVGISFLALGSVVLAFTGVEALYVDMGHFGKGAVRRAWFFIVFPALILNYMGQGAAVLANPEIMSNPFFMSAPSWALIPLVILATMATIIASQAVISGMFSIANQAVQLGLLPRLRVEYTSRYEIGQIYVPAINYILFFLVLIVVITFKDSKSLAGAYGIAVVGTMLTTTIAAGAILMYESKHKILVFLLFLFFFAFDSIFFIANLEKLKTGGLFPIMIAALVLIVLRIWIVGSKYYRETIDERSVPLKNFLQFVKTKNLQSVSGNAVYMTPSETVTPRPLVENLKHNKILHEKVFFLTIKIVPIPFTDKKDFITLRPIMNNFYRITATYGFKEIANVTKILSECKERFGLVFDLDETSVFISHDTLKVVSNEGLSETNKKIFVWLNHNAAKASDFFNIPSHRVIEIGTNIEL